MRSGTHISWKYSSLKFFITSQTWIPFSHFLKCDPGAWLPRPLTNPLFPLPLRSTTGVSRPQSTGQIWTVTCFGQSIKLRLCFVLLSGWRGEKKKIKRIFYDMKNYIKLGNLLKSSHIYILSFTWVTRW